MTKTHELKITPEDECYTEMNLDRTAIEELGKHFTKGFDIGLKNIAIGSTQKEIDKMVDVLKAGEHFKRGFKRGLKNNSTSLKEVDIITVHSEDLTATIQRYLDLGYLCDVRAFRSKGYMEPEYQIVILKKE